MLKIMHKDKEVASFECDDRGIVSKVLEVKDRSLFPCFYTNDEELRLGLQMWLFERNISKTRKDIEPLVAFYGHQSFKPKNKVTLTDCYWVKESDEEKWEDINPHNVWSPIDDGYFNLIHSPTEVSRLDTNSPNLTLPGMSKRFWYVKDGQLGIITEECQKDMEVYKAGKQIGNLKFVADREYVIIKGVIYSFKKVEYSEDVERVPFSYYYDSVADNSLKKIQNLENCCNKYGFEDWKDFFGSVMKIDSQTGNNERNLCEIGVLRNTETLEFVGFEKI